MAAVIGIGSQEFITPCTVGLFHPQMLGGRTQQIKTVRQLMTF